MEQRNLETRNKMKPILFSTEMVKAILEGRKTMTRRIIKSKHESGMIQICKSKDTQSLAGYYHGIMPESLDWDERNVGNIICPYGKVGDTLWVRETWRIIAWSWATGYFTIQYKDGTKQRIEDYIDDLHAEKWINQCTKDAIAAGRTFNDSKKIIENCEPDDFRWRPSIFMPKEACRLFLRITDIRVERLQEISEEDAIAEGAPDEVPVYGLHPLKPKSKPKWYVGTMSVTPKEGFRYLWESINGPESWKANPFVWVVSFERINKPE